MNLSHNYLEHFFEEGKDGGRDDPSDAAAINAQNGDQLYLVRGIPMRSFCHLYFCWEKQETECREGTSQEHAIKPFK